jgi:hypothetical protein
MHPTQLSNLGACKRCGLCARLHACMHAHTSIVHTHGTRRPATRQHWPGGIQHETGGRAAGRVPSPGNTHPDHLPRQLMPACYPPPAHTRPAPLHREAPAATGPSDDSRHHSSQHCHAGADVKKHYAPTHQPMLLPTPSKVGCPAGTKHWNSPMPRGQAGAIGADQALEATAWRQLHACPPSPEQGPVLPLPHQLQWSVCGLCCCLPGDPCPCWLPGLPCTPCSTPLLLTPSRPGGQATVTLGGPCSSGRGECAHLRCSFASGVGAASLCKFPWLPSSRPPCCCICSSQQPPHTHVALLLALLLACCSCGCC